MVVTAALFAAFALQAATKRLKIDHNYLADASEQEETTNAQSKPPSDGPSSFSKTLDYAKNVMVYARDPIFKAACDSSAFTCEEIIKLASFGEVGWGNDHSWGPDRWVDSVILFAKGRANEGCISDPDIAPLIVDAFEERWVKQWQNDGAPYTGVQHQQWTNRLTQTFITDKAVLKPAKGVEPPPTRLRTGHRTEEDMKKLLADLRHMMPNAFFEAPGEPLEKKFQAWLKQIRANGEQFSGPQLVTLVNAIPKGFGLAWAVSILLEYLEQFVTGVTCEEVNVIQRRMAYLLKEEWRIPGLAALKSNIVDVQNKVAVVADPTANANGFFLASSTEKVLQDVVVGLPPKNNPVFGVVKGNPVILVVDESDSMDVKFTLGDDTITRRNFCQSQLEMALKGLPDGTYFNVIQYDNSPVRIFQMPVLVSEGNINETMDKVSSKWMDDYKLGQDPRQWLRKIKGFALNFKPQFNGRARNSMEALKLAYATANLPSQQTEAIRHAAKEQRTAEPQDGQEILTKGLPQIYFLTSGQPDGGADQILDKIDEFDNGRNIPVNSIVFSSATNPDRLAYQLGRSLASKTGGFFRSIDQD